MSDKIKNIEKSLEKLTNKDFNVMFFVVDTKGVPSGSLAYIYETAYQLQQAGYKVKMLHAEKEFVGVGDWLGEKYAAIPHECIDKDNTTTVSPADFLFIQEVYTSAMSATKQLPCKRIVIFQNFSLLADTCPMGVSFDDLKIRACITTTEDLKEKIKRFFPDVKVDIVHRAIPATFKSDKNKKLIINIVANNKHEINEIVKPFYWKYPQYKWVAFRPIPNNLTREDFAKALGESFATIWCDTKTDFGQAAVEALAAGNIVIGKLPENGSEWIYKDGGIRDNGLWFYNSSDACDMIASTVQSFITDTIPDIIYKEGENTVSAYTEEQQNKEILEVYPALFNLRKGELEKLIEVYKKNEKEE